MVRRVRIRDVLLLPLVAVVRVRKRQRLAGRVRRADARRRGSLTYNRQQALRRWQERGGGEREGW